MANITQLAMDVESLRATLALQQEQIDAAQVTSDNVWILGRAFTVLTMVSITAVSGVRCSTALATCLAHMHLLRSKLGKYFTTQTYSVHMFATSVVFICADSQCWRLDL